jgi:hypothetical protein
MYELCIEEEGRPQRIFRLERTAVVIGRLDTVDLVLPDVSVSRRHAELRPSGSGWEIVDLQSANGTQVNGADVPRAVALRLGDIVAIGKFRLTYRETIEGEIGGEVYRPSGGYEVEESTAVDHLPPPSQQRAKLVDADTDEVHFLDAGSLVLGKDVKLRGVLPFVTKATIRWSGDAHEITRGGFLTALQVNGAHTQRHTLQPGDVIQVGATRLRYEA